MSSTGSVRPNQSRAIRLTMPLLGPSSRIQPLISSTDGISIGASVNRSVRRRTLESVRSTSHARKPPIPRTSVAVAAAYSAELASAFQMRGRPNA
jgi:hypothetical protein